MKNLKRLTALLCAFACVFSLTELFTVANEQNVLTPISGTGLTVYRSGNTAYLCGVPCNSSAEGVKNLIKGDCEIYTKTETLKTGDTITLFADGIAKDEATIIISGDVNDDGIVNGKDVVRFKKLMGTNIPALQTRCMDMNNDGIINENDLSDLASMCIPQIQSVEFLGTPEKTVYNEGESFSSKGVYLNVKYTDGTILSYGDGFGIIYPSGSKYLSVSDTNVTLKYGNTTKKFTVKVNPVTSFDARITKADSSLCVAFADTNVLLSNTALKSSQIWTFTKQSNGSYEIKNKDTGKCIEVESTSVSNGTNIRVGNDSNSTAQRWTLERNDDGTYVIKSVLGEYVMDIHAGLIENNRNIQAYTPNGSNAQSFEIENVTDIENQVEASAVDLGENLMATVTGVVSKNNVAVIATGSSNVVMKASAKTVRQLWRFAKQSDGSYMIINQENGKALAVSDSKAANGTNIEIVDKNTSANTQRWFIIGSSSGYSIVPKCSSSCVLEIYAGSTEADTNVQIGTYNGRASSQQFTITSFSGNYMEYTAPVNIGSHFNARISPSFAASKKISLSGGTNVIIYGASEHSEQVWRFERQSNNSYKIINNSNGKVLTVPNSDTTAGTALQVTADNGSNAQRWYLCPKEDSFIIQSALSKNAVLDVYAASSNDGTKIDIYKPNLTDAQIFKIDNSQHTAMSYNVYCGNVTTERMSRVVTKMKKYMPDTIGIQEATPTWMNYLQANLGDTYAIVGLGRDGGSAGEHSSILYNKHIFNLTGWGTKWLSATPDTVSRFPESMYNRIFTYAFLQRKSDLQMILVINTHLEYTTDAIRLKQLAIIQDFIDKHGNDYPVYISGDYNADFGSAACTKMEQYGYMNGSTATTSITGATFTNYGAENRILDYIYYSKNDFKLNYYKVCNEYINGSWTSDHHPIYVRFSIVK